MTNVPREPTPLTDEALQLIGAIAVEAARIEWQLAGLRSIVDEAMTHEVALAVRQGDQVKEIITHLSQRENDGTVGDVDEAVTWTERAGDLLNRRGELMHSTWIVGASGGVASHHLRSGRTNPVDVTELSEVVDELREHAGLGVAMWLMAATWEQLREA